MTELKDAVAEKPKPARGKAKPAAAKAKPAGGKPAGAKGKRPGGAKPAGAKAAKGGATGPIAEAKAAAAAPNADARAHIRLGSLLQQDASQATQSEAAFRRALELEPGHAVAAKKLSDLLMGRGAANEARELLRQAAEASPRKADIQIDYAKSLIKSGDAAGAETALRRVIASSPDNVSAVRLLAGLLEQRNEVMEALFLTQYAAKLSPENKTLKKKIRAMRKAAFETA